MSSLAGGGWERRGRGSVIAIDNQCKMFSAPAAHERRECERNSGKANVIESKLTRAGQCRGQWTVDSVHWTADKLN